MTGIYTVDFYDNHHGIIMGGNWEKKSENYKNKAVTTDGGKNWKLVADHQVPGYISSVQYVPDSGGKKLVAVSTEGIYFSEDSGDSWKKISNKGFYALRFQNAGTAWLSGNGIIAKMTLK